MSREEMACHAEGRNAALRRVQEGRGESRAGTEAARRYLKFFFSLVSVTIHVSIALQ